jgi:phospholipase/carboxylesterase
MKLPALLALALLTGGCDACTQRSLPAVTSAPRNEAAGVRFIEILTGGASESDRLPLIVGIHGRGGSPEAFSRSLASLSVRARVILPYGFNASGSGFSWWGDWVDDARFADDTRRAADRLAAMLDELSRTRPTAGKPIVTGFSQGGMLSFTLAVLHPEAVRAAFPMGGLLAKQLWPSAWPPGAPKPVIRAFHGTADERVPVDSARGTVRRLAEIGLAAELVEYPGLGHHVSSEEQRDLVRAIEQAAAAP